jgi:hypothetical protein
MMLRMSPLPRSLMTSLNSKKRPQRFRPEGYSPWTNAIVIAVFCALFGGAFWISLTQTLDQQQRQHCEQGWQPACEKLK